MALIVEDGTGLEDADAYVSIADADARATAFNDLDWLAQGTAAKEIAIREATQDLDYRFGRRWFGDRKTQPQALDWPRNNVIDNDGFQRDSISVPREVENATIDHAFEFDATVGFSTVIPAGSQDVKELEDTVGPLKTKRVFSGVQSTQIVYPLLAKNLQKLISGPGELERS